MTSQVCFVMDVFFTSYVVRKLKKEQAQTIAPTQALLLDLNNAQPDRLASLL